ncbi:MAG: HAMP domain-containing histidine kinase [Lachnospiraceae bacterium]|nr:HAMP domain-containing histidine kinase [Lachnospiraceae bacterium]
MKKLSVKMFFSFLLVSLLIIAALYLCIFFMTPYAGEKNYSGYIKSRSEDLAQRCMNSTYALADEMINGFAASEGVSAKLTDADSFLRENDKGELFFPLRFSDRSGEYVLCITPVSYRTQAFQNSLSLCLPIVVLLAVFISFIGAKIFSYYMKKPIVRMSKIAERMAEQDFGWYCPDERDDEIGVLAKSLNKLSDELSAALSKLNDKNLYLENEIDLEKERERRRMLFFAGVSHELKTPISVVIGQIDGMRDSIGVYKDRDKYLAKCSDTLNELLAFINEILLVSHIDMGDGSKAEKVKIDGILDEEIAFYDTLISEKDIELTYDVPDNVEFTGDEKLLKKALGNVVGNAIKYTPSGGSVRIKLDKPQDSGSGKTELKLINSPAHIDEQHIPHLFEAFYRVDPGKEEGSGLGLYISAMVFEMCGAEYAIANTSDGVEFILRQ